MSSSPFLISQKCLVLGAAGFIGANLCEALVDKVGELHAFGRKVCELNQKDIKWHIGDFSNPASMSEALQGCDLVYHLINSGTPFSSNFNKLSDLNLNVGNTIQFLDLCREAKVSRVVFVSSGGAVYGNPSHLPISESHPTNPITAYGITKLSIEKYLALYEHLYGLKYVILRVSNPFGPRQSTLKNQGIVAVLLEKIQKNLPVEIWGDGSIIRDFIYIEDVIAALILAGSYTGNERIFNIGSGAGASIMDIVSLIKKFTHREIDLRFLESRKVDVAANILDIKLAVQELKWHCNTSLEAGMAKTCDWYRRYA